MPGVREWLSDLDHRVLLKTIIFAVLLALVWYDQGQGETAVVNRMCATLNQSNASLHKYIDTQLARAEKTLPTLDYYKQHPSELHDALNRIIEQRRETDEALAPTDC